MGSKTAKEETMELQLVQIYYGGGQLKPPPCGETDCKNRAIGLWKTKAGKGLDLCGQHEPTVTPERWAEFLQWQDKNWGNSGNSKPRPTIIALMPTTENVAAGARGRQETTV